MLSEEDRVGAWSEVAGGADFRAAESRRLRALVEKEFVEQFPETVAELHLIDARMIVDGDTDESSPVSEAVPETIERYRTLAAVDRLLREYPEEFPPRTLEQRKSQRERIIGDVDRRYLLLVLLAHDGEGPLGW